MSRGSLGHHQRAEDGEGHDHDHGEALDLPSSVGTYVGERGVTDAVSKKKKGGGENEMSYSMQSMYTS